MKRTALKNKQVKRDWCRAVAKKAREQGCRVCGDGYNLESAHIIGRSQDEPDEKGVLIVHEDSTIPLCQKHHKEYDARRFDLLPYLTSSEQARATYEAGGIVSALRRISGEPK